MADDITLFFTGTDPDKLTVSANNFFASLKMWTDLNCLKINANKTKALLFRPRNEIARVSTNLWLGGNNIEFVQKIKALSAFFSEHLTWDQHINHVGMKLNKLNGLMSKHRHFLTQNTEKLLYISLFLPSLSYCHVIWGTTTNQNILKLLVVQKRSLRIITNAPWFTSTRKYFNELNIINVLQMHNFRLVSLYKNTVTMNHAPLLQLSNLIKHIPSYNIRQPEIWKLPTVTNLVWKSI